MGDIIVAIIAAAGIPSLAFGFMFGRLQKKLDKRDAELEKKEEAKKQNEVLLIKTVGASLSLSEAIATAVQRIPDAKCNGDMHAALDYARKIKHEQKDFLYAQGVENIVS